MLVWINYQSLRYPVVLPINPTIEGIKKGIENEQHLGFEVQDQQLFYQSTLLENNNARIEHYGIQPNSEIVLLVIRRINILFNSARLTVSIWDQERVLQLQKKVARMIHTARLHGVELLHNGSELKLDRKISTIPIEDTLVAAVLFGVKVEGKILVYEVIVHNRMTVAQVKQKLHTKYGLEPEKLKLLCSRSRNFLDDGATLMDYGIHKEGTVIPVVGDMFPAIDDII
ncbi:hypothetical protein JCGZ_11072 [Jatropha curcas]|uniref:Ubiquitin-like domain-containing protein n=1 Tax=Jatropha curcas TaxID=180498 RepID=A0A067KEG8_JATCU|nr:uncharacterized protein LOC110009884 [Jatropha curcas]KDP34522.1 hypothetical protein JCGZ_11072 [Jatropha curcas]